MKSQFWDFRSGENLPNSSCHFPNQKLFFLQNLHHPSVSWKIIPLYFSRSPNHKSVFLQSLHHSSVSWKIIPLYFFRSNVMYFAQKEPIKVQLFVTFECLGKDSPNFCRFWNKISVFLQILYHSSVSWVIIPLYF